MGNLVWMLMAFDWTSLTYSSLLEPQKLEREEIIDLDAIQARSTLVYSRLWLPETLGDIDGCAPTRARVAVPYHVAPLQSEIDHWSAVQLTPSSWPFRVDEIVYYLGHEGNYDATLEHTVALYVSTRDTPPPNADPIVAHSFQLSSAVAGYNQVTWTLDEPFELEEDEHLYVTLQHTGDWPDRLSILTCSDADDNGWWSNEAEKPYDWEELSSWSIDGAPMISASGYRVIN